MPPRMRWPASARTPRSTRACERCFRRGASRRRARVPRAAVTRTSRGSSTTRMRTSRAKPPSAINDAPVESARTPRSPRKLDDAPVDGRGVRRTRHQCQLPSRRAPPMRRRWRSTPRATPPRTACAPRRCCSSACGAKSPQRDRVVGIYPSAAPRAMRKPRPNALAAVLPKVLGKGPEAGAARGARSHRQPAAARRRADAGRGRRQREGAGSRARRRAQGARRVRRRRRDARHRRRGEIQRRRAAPRGAADRRAPRARARAAHRPRLSTERLGGRTAGRVPGDGPAQDRGDARSCWSPRSISSPPARCSRARSSS